MKFSLTILATLVCGTAMAQNLRVAPGRQAVVPAVNDPAPAVFGSNLILDACTGCNYDSIAGGYYVWGTNNCITPLTTQWIAVPFWSAKTGTTKQVSAAINLDPTCSPNGSQVTLGIYSDLCATAGTQSTVGTVIAMGNAKVPAAPCALALAKVTAALTAGTKYWVVATTTAAGPQQNLDAIWYASNEALIGGNVASGGWFSFSGLVPGFQVQ